MPELIGMLMEKGSQEAKVALHSVDASTGLTPIQTAFEWKDRIAVYEIVSPRNSRKDNSKNE